MGVVILVLKQEIFLLTSSSREPTQGLREVLTLMLGHQPALDHVEVVGQSSAKVNAPRKRATEKPAEYGPCLPTYPQAVPSHDVVGLVQAESVPLSLGVPLEEVRAPGVVVGEVITEHAKVAAGPDLVAKVRAVLSYTRLGVSRGEVVHLRALCRGRIRMFQVWGLASVWVSISISLGGTP